MSGLDAVLVHIGRVIGKPPGWERTVRALAPPSRFAGSHVHLTQVPDGYIFPVDPGTLIGWSVYFFGTYEPEVRAQIIERLTTGGVAIDVGANIGWHALLMASRVGPTGRVYAFEPNESTRNRLRGAVDANRFSQITIESHALAECEGRLGFEAPDAGHFWDGTGRLSRDTVGSAGAVECTTLDAFVVAERIARVALVKIDVEGWELAVLRGAGHVLNMLRPVIVFEFDPAYVERAGGTAAELTAVLLGAGYALFALRRGQIPQAISGLRDRGGNFLALPREQTDHLS
jgi:FkbM family methyltransferase